MSKILRDSRENNALLQAAGIYEPRTKLIDSLVRVCWLNNEDEVRSDSLCKIATVCFDTDKEGEMSLEIVLSGLPLSALVFDRKNGWQVKSPLPIDVSEVEVEIIDNDDY